MTTMMGISTTTEGAPLTETQVRSLEADLTRALRRLIARSVGGFRNSGASPGRPPGASLEASLEDLPPGPRREATLLLAALGRMASGSYGICAGCKRPIGFERLEAIPETVWCRSCSPPGPVESPPVP
jgi:hypothetical protein